MSLEVLVSTMFQKDNPLVEKMNISSDVIIVNQCDIDESKTYFNNKNKVTFITIRERGIGKSRNKCLELARSKYSIFADDDIVYYDDYASKIINEFETINSADVILFNFHNEDKNRAVKINKVRKKINYFNCLRYGAVNIAIKTDAIKEKNIKFSLDFGGGTKHGSGEDSLFLIDCLKNGLNVYASTEVIGLIKKRQSTWFESYNEKYFIDKGALFYNISEKYAFLLCLQFVLRKYNIYKVDMSFLAAIKYLMKGIKIGREEAL
ncbi:MAG: glycosyltransferase [Lachnospirales bacterium]